MASNMHYFKIHEDDKENTKVPGNSKGARDYLIRSTKASGTSKDSALRDIQKASGTSKVSALRDIQSNVLPPERAKCKTGSSKGYSALLKQEINGILGEKKKGVHQNHDNKTVKAAATDIQSEQTKRPKFVVCPGGCKKIISASLNVQFRRSECDPSCQALFRPEINSTLKEKNNNENQQAQKTRTRSSSTTTYSLRSTLPINSAKSRKSTSSVPFRDRTSCSTPKVEKSTPKVEKSEEDLNKCSPIKPNHFTSSNTLITRRPKCQRNAKLKKRAVKRTTGCYSYVGDIYNEEYLEVIMEIIVAKERRIVLPAHFLEKFNPDRKFRASIVNWMLETQGKIAIGDEVFYLAVNLLDQVLATITVPVNMYQLLALSTIWIANKLIGSDSLRASTLTELCGNAYLKYQLVRMERKVLKMMNFEIHSIEPSLCVNYYLKILEIDQLQLARFSVYYILDCSTLLPEFSSSRLSILTAAAVNVAIKLYCRDLEEKSSTFFSRNLSVGDIEKRKSLESMMYSQILNMSNENYLFREAFYKYSCVSNRVPFS